MWLTEATVSPYLLTLICTAFEVQVYQPEANQLTWHILLILTTCVRPGGWSWSGKSCAGSFSTDIWSTSLHKAIMDYSVDWDHQTDRHTPVSWRGRLLKSDSSQNNPSLNPNSCLITGWSICTDHVGCLHYQQDLSHELLCICCASSVSHTHGMLIAVRSLGGRVVHIPSSFFKKTTLHNLFNSS